MTDAAPSQTSRSLGSFLVSSNPFYFLSALLVLGGVRMAYGEIPVGSLDCWTMLGVLAGYTTLMAAAAVLVVRRVGVWDDARSILITLVLLLVAMSVSFDELLVIAPDDALALTLAGWAFAAVLSEATLRLAGIRLPAAYRIPYHLALLLLFWFPLFVSPELTGLIGTGTHRRVLLFPWLAAGVALTLAPAVWLGERSVAGNTTPWRWPWFPWSLFVFLGVVCLLRSYVLTLSFGPSDGLETTFGPLHMLPLMLATASLLLLAGIRHDRPGLRAAAMALPIAAAGLTLPPWSREAAALLDGIAADYAAPQAIAFLAAAAFYAFALLRRVAGADLLLAACLAVGLPPLGEAYAITDQMRWLLPLCVGAFFFAVGGLTRSPLRMTAGTLMVAAFWMIAPLQEPWMHIRWGLATHTAIVGLMVMVPVLGGVAREFLVALLGLAFFGCGLVAALMGGLTDLPPLWSVGYLAALTVVVAAYAWAIGEDELIGIAVAIAVVLVLRGGWLGLKTLAAAIGPGATIALVGGLISFVVAGAISIRKGRLAQA